MSCKTLIQTGCLFGLRTHLGRLGFQCRKAGSCHPRILHGCLRSRDPVLSGRLHSLLGLIIFHLQDRLLRHFSLRLFFFRRSSLICATHRNQNIIDRFLRFLNRRMPCTVPEERHVIFRFHDLCFRFCRMNTGNDLPHTLCQFLLKLLCIKRLLRSFLFLRNSSCCSGRSGCRCVCLQIVFHYIGRHHSCGSAGAVSPGLILLFRSLLLCSCRMLAYCLGKLLLCLGNDVLCDRIRFVGRHFIHNDLFQLRNGSLHPFLDRHQIFIPMIIDRLLHRCELRQ